MRLFLLLLTARLAAGNIRYWTGAQCNGDLKQETTHTNNRVCGEILGLYSEGVNASFSPAWDAVTYVEKVTYLSTNDCTGESRAARFVAGEHYWPGAPSFVYACNKTHVYGNTGLADVAVRRDKCLDYGSESQWYSCTMEYTNGVAPRAALWVSVVALLIWQA